MKIVGVIVEYNPFHNGHIYHLEATKKLFPNSKVVVLMSGNVCQRGSFAIVNKIKRARIALRYSADAVVELPRFETLQAAHLFAEYSVKILNAIGIDNLVFGSESNDINKLKKIARLQLEQQPLINKNIKKFLKTGLSYPKAYNETLKMIINESVEDSNDMLGIQYIKAIFKNNFNISPHSIERTIPFHSKETKMNYASATLIRSLVLENKDITKYTPLKIKYFKDQRKQNAKIYRRLIKIFAKKDIGEIKNFHLVNEGIENLIAKQLKINDHYESLVESCVSRRYTRSRIQRTLMSIYFNIPKRDEKQKILKRNLNILAINKNNKLLKRHLRSVTIDNYEQ